MTLVVFPTAWVDFLPDTLVSPDVAVSYLSLMYDEYKIKEVTIF